MSSCAGVYGSVHSESRRSCAHACRRTSDVTASALEEEGDDEVLDAMVDSCLDEVAANQET